MKYSWAAVLVVALFLGGTVGAYAEKEGVFHWINKDVNNNVYIASPDPLNAEQSLLYSYETFEDVPLNYVRFLWAPTSTNVLKDFTLNNINVFDCNIYILGECQFKNEDLFITFSKTEYNKIVTSNSSSFDSFKVLDIKEINGTEVELYEKINDDYTEYISCFYKNNSVYTINTNIKIEELEEILSDSIY